MTAEIKELENSPEKTVYQFGEGRNAMQLTISRYPTEYMKLFPEDEVKNYKGGRLETAKDKTDCLEIKLTYGEDYFYSIKQKSIEDAYEDWDIFEGEYLTWLAVERKVDAENKIAEKLYADESIGALNTRTCLQQIKGNPLIDKINQRIEDLRQRADKIKHRREMKELNNSKLAILRKRAAKFADKGSEVLGLEKAVKKVTRGKKIANVKISPKIKAKEKKFSDLFFGRVKD